MKINSISAMSYCGGVSNRNSFKQNSAMTAPQLREVNEYPKGYMPYQINFAGGGYSKLPGIVLLKTVKDLPCLYCAKKMVQSKEIQKLGSQDAVVTRSVKELVDVLHKKIGSVGGAAESFVKAIEATAKQTPNANSLEFIQNFESTNKVVPEFIKKYVQRPMTGSEYAKTAVNFISGYEDALMPTERSVFKMIKEAFDKNPNQSISNILFQLKSKNLGDFSGSQAKIIDEIEEIAKANLSKATRDKVLRETQFSKKLLNSDGKGVNFRRNKFIEVLNRISYSNNETDTMAKILEKAESMSSSANDARALIEKFTGKNTPSGNAGAISKLDFDFVRRLLEPSVQSVEHIRPQVTFKTRGGYTGAKDVIENLALAHKQCNSDRGHLTLQEYMKMNPKAKESIQKHVDFIVNEIKAGRLKGLEDYPKQLQETFAKETNGRLVLDIPEIKAYIEKFLTANA